ncbi:sugar phosphate isomerase/epimerase [Candidatus Woesearchaeota archaeon]|nr:sugar phosphate isomerase/epimerase [Candidatus Woesearchaeota archaeon]MBW2994648.1 sugar phosphate isomerase/epimerase [Candidatus Woesearchaeota archaeon]
MWQESWTVDAQLKCLELVKDLDLDGIEIHFSEQELFDKAFQKFQGKLDKYFVTFHMPALTKPKEAFDKVRIMIPLLNIQQVVIHADEWDKLQDKPDDIPFVIENCDKNKPNFQNLKDVAEFNKNICIDINHIEQTNPGKLSEQITAAKNLIKEVHVSCLKNPVYDTSLKTHHHLITGSDYKIPDCVPKDIIWVIEGVVPKDRLDLLEQEIALLRKLG